MHMKSIRVFKRHNRRELPDICSVARPGTATLRRFMLPICTLRQLMVLKAALIVCLSVLLRAWGQRLNDSICFQDASFYGYCHTSPDGLSERPATGIGLSDWFGGGRLLECSPESPDALLERRSGT